MRLRFVLLTAALLAFPAGEAMAQARIITGQVLDSLSGEPVAGGRVTIQGTSLEAPVRRDGTFSIGAPPEANRADRAEHRFPDPGSSGRRGTERGRGILDA